jgi:hypothetical protein
MQVESREMVYEVSGSTVTHQSPRRFRVHSSRRQPRQAVRLADIRLNERSGVNHVVAEENGFFRRCVDRIGWGINGCVIGVHVADDTRYERRASAHASTSERSQRTQPAPSTTGAGSHRDGAGRRRTSQLNSWVTVTGG